MNTWRDAVPSRDAQLEMKRDAIYREAAAAFNRRGFHGTSMDDIAHALGVTKAALYRYVPNKHQLLYRCHLDAMDAAFASLEHGRAAGGSGLEMLERTLRGYLGAIIDEFGHRVVLLEEGRIVADGTHEELLRTTPAYAEVLTRAAEAGSTQLETELASGVGSEDLLEDVPQAGRMTPGLGRPEKAS